MKLSLPNISLAFAAGCLGGLVNAVFLWGFGAIGFTGALGVKIAPPFTAPWLYQRLVWGGFWGWIFLLPVRLSYPARVLLFSLGPFCVASFVVLPFQAQKGVLGLQLGYLTPVFVLSTTPSGTGHRLVAAIERNLDRRMVRPEAATLPPCL